MKRRRGQTAWFVLMGVIIVAGGALLLMLMMGGSEVTVVSGLPVSPGPVVASAEPGPRLSDDERSEAENIFLLRCAACHRPDGSGIVGPSLIDENWVHGQDLESIRRGIAEGYPEQGMPPQKDVLTDEDILLVARYVLELGSLSHE